MHQGLRRFLARLLELFYDGPLSPLYPLLTHVLFGGAWADWQRTVAMWLVSAACIVELGSGPGDLAAWLARPGRAVVAVDLSRRMTRIAHRRTAGLREVCIVRADARALPVRDSTVDAVITTFPTTFFLEETTNEEVARVLRPGGRYIALVAVRPTWWPLWMRPWSPILQRLLGPLPANNCETMPQPRNNTRLKGDWVRVELPNGVLCLWVARKVHEEEPIDPLSAPNDSQ
ncbi:class I SAM-dependent methyltransferase [Thermomicrobium sp. CFH 73360]|uniref:class I SAM-dependent methyltransferase n=1 Tax=Thermomicrobium sp. CFH 73360 TaxID=2951987 RepID=UPI0020774E6F|nr:class I SAM-dependent methyltransferase [Thermomicrobium sp. CFH 73360]MCM8746703.1 class I SAM-dependent methyltransferase [Thermomicrobium sp. CFH 73360]